jgi:Zn-dependent peptidase ImmA (M78 family)
MQALHALKPEQGNPDVARYARHFKVSTLVILRRLFDGGYLDRGAFFQLFDAESNRLASLTTSSGGDFYRSQFSRTGTLFARAVVVSAMEGHTLYRDAYQMLGIKKQSTFDEMARGLGETL